MLFFAHACQSQMSFFVSETHMQTEAVLSTGRNQTVRSKPEGM